MHFVIGRAMTESSLVIAGTFDDNLSKFHIKRQRPPEGGRYTFTTVALSSIDSWGPLPKNPQEVNGLLWLCTTTHVLLAYDPVLVCCSAVFSSNTTIHLSDRAKIVIRHGL